MSAVGAARVTTSVSSSNPYVRLRRSTCTLSVGVDRKKRKGENEANLYTTTNFSPLPIGLRARQLSVLYVAKFAEAVYVLHAFEKKTQQTAQRDIDLAKSRFRVLVAERRRERR